MAKAKVKRYNGEDGSVTEGQNANIDDDTRARALKWVQQQSEEASSDEGSGEKTVSRSTKAKAVSKPAERKGPTADDETGKSRGRPAEGEPIARNGNGRTRTREEMVAAIPTGGKPGAGATPSKGNSASGSELGRNIKNTLNALGPTRLAGLGNAAVEAGMTARAAKAAETAKAAREAKVMNPNAWMAGPKGMKENFKKGGDVKGWGSARGARKAKIY